MIKNVLNECEAGSYWIKYYIFKIHFTSLLKVDLSKKVDYVYNFEMSVHKNYNLYYLKHKKG